MHGARVGHTRCTVNPEDLHDLPLERRTVERRRRDVPVEHDRRRTDRRASRIAPVVEFVGVAVVVDSWPLMRAGIRQLLEGQGFRVAADTTSVADAVAEVGDRLDLAVIGATSEDLVASVERVQRLQRGEQTGRTLLLMEQVDAVMLRRLLGMGVDGVVQRSIGMEDLAAACSRLLAGHRVLSGGPLSVLASAGLEVSIADDEPAEDGVSFTPKEKEVLGHLAQHRSNREIAAAMHLSQATVKTHLTHIYAKLEVSSRREAIAVSVARGLLA